MNESFDPTKHRETYGVLESDLEAVNKKITGEKTIEELKELIAEKEKALDALEAEKDKAHEAGNADNVELDKNNERIESIKNELLELEARQSEITGPKAETHTANTIQEKLKSLGSPAVVDKNLEGGTISVTFTTQMLQSLQTYTTAIDAWKNASITDPNVSIAHGEVPWIPPTNFTLETVIVHQDTTTPKLRDTLIAHMDTLGYRPPTLAEFIGFTATRPDLIENRSEILNTYDEVLLEPLCAFWDRFSSFRVLSRHAVVNEWESNRFVFVRK